MNCNAKRSSANIFPQAARYMSKSRGLVTPDICLCMLLCVIFSVQSGYLTLWLYAVPVCSYKCMCMCVACVVSGRLCLLGYGLPELSVWGSFRLLVFVLLYCLWRRM
jgi:hypothetical protein